MVGTGGLRLVGDKVPFSNSLKQPVHSATGEAPGFVIGEYLGYVGCWGSQCCLYTYFVRGFCPAILGTAVLLTRALVHVFFFQVGEASEPATDDGKRQIDVAGGKSDVANLRLPGRMG